MQSNAPLITRHFEDNVSKGPFITFQHIAGHLPNAVSTRGEKVEMERDVSYEGKGSNVPSRRHKVESVLSIDLYRELSKAPSRGAKN